MKKIFYLLTIACMLVACEDSNKTGKGTEPTGLSVPAEGTAGAKITVVGQDIAKDAEFYLSNTDSKTELKAEVLASGAEVTLPYTLGEYTLSIEQGGSSYNAGTIKVAVTGIVMPEEATAGEEITITANGFADDATIFFGSEEADAAFTAAGCTVTVPATAGETTVTVKQKGTEQELGTVVVTEAGIAKDIKNFTISMMGDPAADFAVEYDSNGKPVSFDAYSITSKDNKYTFTGDDISWTFTIEKNRVASINISGKEYEWKYDEDGHLVEFYVDDVEPYYLDYDNDGNSIYGRYEDKSLICAPNRIDIANVLAMLMTIEENSVVYFAAAVLGWAGTPSTNLPSHVELDEDTVLEYTYDIDADGFVNNIVDEMGIFDISIAY
ncbi:MAG: hypothetical protein NC335_06000 [Bacteroides sp.]|nr:hypothetical protein [Bacteroides sp.]